jgi:hypothetical protein
VQDEEGQKIACRVPRQGPETSSLSASPLHRAGLGSAVAIALSVACVALSVLGTVGASAATIVVANTGDAANGGFDDLGCTLRDAVEAANDNASDPNGCNGDNAGADTIILQSGQTYMLTQHGVDDTNAKGDLDVVGPVTIRSSGPGLATIDARSNIFAGPNPPAGADRAVDILPSAGAVTLEGLRIEDGLALPGKTIGGGGGVLNEASLTVRNSEVVGNQEQGMELNLGGGIYSRGPLAELTVIGSTIANNKAVSQGAGETEAVGGGIASYQSSKSLTILNSTVSGNSASGSGGGGLAGGVFAGDNVNHPVSSLVHVTITSNSANRIGGLEIGEGTLTGNLIAANTDLQEDTPDCRAAGPVTSGAGNLLGSSGQFESTCELAAPGDLLGTFAAPILPNLGTLVDNGGPTKTQIPNPGSPAIDRGAACPETDQRGLFRAAAAPCDSGAVEIGATASPPAAPVAPAIASPPVVSQLASPPLAAPGSKATGRRAAALARCKKKKTKKARGKCRVKARKLPL